MLKYKIMIKLFVLKCVSEECLGAVCIVSSSHNTRNMFVQEVYNMLLNKIKDENYI